MKIRLAVFLCLMTCSLLALESPRPIQGIPTITGKQFSLHVSQADFLFAFPEGWGMGETSATASGGNFTLFPNDGGYGCVIQIKRFENKTLVNEEVARLKATFASTKPITGGFEAAVKKARYSCYSNDLYVIQIWYSLPKTSSESSATWEKLKQCVTIPAEQETTDTEWVALKELPGKGWQFNHPDRHLHVLFKSDFIVPSKPTEDPHALYLLQIGDISSSGFFYLKWDQQDLNTRAPYQIHLEEMMAEISKLESEQRFEDETIFDEKEGWAFLRGEPYSLVSLAGDHFLFGFAIKNKNRFLSYDINDYVKRVQWWCN